MNPAPSDEHHTHASTQHAQRSYERVARAESSGHREHEGHAEHDKHAGHSVAMFRDKFWLSLALTIPTLVWGHMLPSVFGYTPPAFPGSHLVAPLLGTVVFFYGGWPFLQGSIRELRARLPGMMTLIALAIGVAFVFSVVVTLGYPGMPLWEELATLVTIMLLGHWIEMRSINQAQGALAELAKLLPNNAERIVRDASGSERAEEVPLTALRDGDLVLVRPGASIPADGEVHEGSSNVNESMITGESRPVKKRAGDHVIAGTVNGDGSLRITVMGTGDRTALAGIMRLVEQAQTSRSRAQVIADRAAYGLTMVALGAGVVTLVGWLAVGADPAYAVERLVTVLVIACPHALGLPCRWSLRFRPTLGARTPLLVRDRRGLEEARLLNAVVFDKTGTLTLGEHRVVAVSVAPGLEETEALRLAAGVEQDAEHPVARAIVTSATERGLAVPRVTGFEAIPGHGARAELNGRRLAVGGPNLVGRDQVAVPAEVEAFAVEASQRAQGVVYLIEDGRVPRPPSRGQTRCVRVAEAVRRLHAQAIKVVMLTGDARAVAEAVGRTWNRYGFLPRYSPRESRQDPRTATTASAHGDVGDGVNDAPALWRPTSASRSGQGPTWAVEAGDVCWCGVTRATCRDYWAPRATYRKMVQKTLVGSWVQHRGDPLAGGVLAPVGIVLSPAVGAE